MDRKDCEEIARQANRMLLQHIRKATDDGDTRAAILCLVTINLVGGVAMSAEQIDDDEIYVTCKKLALHLDEMVEAVIRGEETV